MFTIPQLFVLALSAVLASASTTSPGTSSPSSESAAVADSRVLDRTPLSAGTKLATSFARIYQEGGFRGLYRGNFINVLKVGPENAIKMYVFDRLGGFRPSESRSVAEQFAMGATAGAVSQAITFPLETIKTRFAVSRTGQFTSLASCAAGVYEGAGLRGFYRGLSAATSGMIPFSGVDLTLLALMHGAWRRHHPDEAPSPVQLLLFGAVSSTCGQLVAYPLQLIRTRLQSQGMPQNPVVYDGLVDCFRRTVRTDGYAGLYRGLTPNLMKALPSMGVSYMVYDVVNRQLKAMEERRGDDDSFEMASTVALK